MATELTHALQLDLLSISDRSRRTCRCIWTLKHTQKPSSHVWRAHIGKELPTSKSISLSRHSMLFTIPFSQWSSGRCFHVSYGLSILQIYFYSSWEKQLNKKNKPKPFQVSTSLLLFPFLWLLNMWPVSNHMKLHTILQQKIVVNHLKSQCFIK